MGGDLGEGAGVDSGCDFENDLVCGHFVVYNRSERLIISHFEILFIKYKIKFQ